MEKLFPRINENFHIHFYDDFGSVFKINSHNYYKIDLDIVGTDILELCTGMNSLSDIFLKISKNYHFNIYDKECQSIFNKFINEFNDKKIISFLRNK